MTQRNTDFRKLPSEKFSLAGLEPTNTFDSAEQISSSAHVDWLSGRAVLKAKASRSCLSGKSDCLRRFRDPVPI
jgi:hypothetical protein